MRATARIPAVVIGAGHAGISTSYYLAQEGIEHVLLERARVAETWRSKRWDSFTLVTPNWMNRLPDFHYDGDDPDGFMLRADVVDYMERFVERNALPLQTGVDVTSVEHARGQSGFLVHTDDETIETDAVVIAVGSFQKERVPDWSTAIPSQVLQIGATEYRNPDALPEGGVVVVGSAQTGCQIAEELNAAGRRVILCVGSAGRSPRRYRGRDSAWWLVRFDPFTPAGQPPRLHLPVELLPSPAWRFAPNPHASGKDGGHTINLHKFARDGITLTGKLAGVEGGKLRFGENLHASLTKADEFAAALFVGVDRYIEEQRLDLPAADDSNTDEYYGRDGFLQTPPTELDPVAEGVSTLIWAGGFVHDFSWVKPAPLDDFRYPIQTGGATSVPGLYFAGLHYLTNASSDLFYGVAEDSKRVASHLAATLRERVAVA